MDLDDENLIHFISELETKNNHMKQWFFCYALGITPSSTATHK